MAVGQTAQKKPDPCAFVIFGVTGDLAHRLVIPALYNLAASDLLPEKFCLVGVARKGMTLVPLSIYFNGRGRAKVELALGRGRKDPDKREYQKEKDWKREQGRLMRERG